MKDKLRQSIQITGSFSWLMFFLSLITTLVASDSKGLPLPSIVKLFIVAAAFIIYVVIYGRIVDHIQEHTFKPSFSWLMEHSFNLFVTGAVLFMPLIIPAIVIFNLTGSPEKAKLLDIISLTLSIITLYVLPYVFVRHQRLAAIKNGIWFFFTHLRLSVSLIIIKILALTFSMTTSFGPFESLYIAGGIIFVKRFILLFVSFTVFALATLILQEHGEFKRVPIEPSPAIDTLS